MTNVLLYILVSSLMCSLCGFSVLLLNRLVKGVSQRFRCNILMLALLLPYLGIFAARYIPVPAYEPGDPSASVVSEQAELPSASGQTEISALSSDRKAETTVRYPYVSDTYHTAVNNLIPYVAACVWSAEILIMLTLGIMRHIRLTTALRGTRKQIRTVGKLRVYAVNMNVSPFLTGFFRPAIYIPADMYTDEELELVIAHETAHYKRGDLYRRLLITVLNCVNWFNPAYRFVLKKVIQQIEYACDEAVTNGLSADASKSYGYMLLKTAENGIKNEYLTVGLGSDAGNLKRRIEMIINNNKKISHNARTLTLAAFVLSAAMCIGGCGASMAVVEPKSDPEDEVIWWSKYYEDPSQVPETVKVGRYYKENGTPEEYVEVYDDGTIQMFGYDHIKAMYELNDRETMDQIMSSEEGRNEQGKWKEYLNKRHKYVYDRRVASICFKDGPDGEDGYIGEEGNEHSPYGFAYASENTIIFSEKTGHIYHYAEYYVNADGKTIGTIPEAESEDKFPDLIPVVGDNGKAGYVYVSELNGDTPSSPEEAVKRHEAIANGTYEPRVINVYEADGKTVIDTFTEQTGVSEQFVLNDDGTYSFIG